MAVTVQTKDRFSRSILAELNIPLFVVDKTAAVLYANAASAAVTGHEGALRNDDKTLAARNHADNIHLHHAIANASLKRERETFTINDFNAARPQFVSVVPFNGEGSQESEALVVVQKCETAGEAFAQALRQLFRLSPSEIAIASALVDGTDAEHIAERRGAKVTTVRTQIAAIMLKTRTRRQGELVAMLSRVASLP